MLSEQDVDQELKAALSVTPSPGFEARVLQRVAAERPARGPVHYGWLAAAASLVLAVGVIYSLNRGATDRTVPPLAAAARTAPPAALPPSGLAPAVLPPAPPAPAVPPRVQQPTATARANISPARPVAPAGASLNAARSTEPQVIVPLNQMEAVRRLVRAVNEGRLEAPAEPPQGPMAVPAQVSVAPVVVEPIPLTPLTGAGGK